MPILKDKLCLGPEVEDLSRYLDSLSGSVDRVPSHVSRVQARTVERRADTILNLLERHRSFYDTSKMEERVLDIKTRAYEFSEKGYDPSRSLTAKDVHIYFPDNPQSQF